jgi:PilZ domain
LIQSCAQEWVERAGPVALSGESNGGPETRFHRGATGPEVDTTGQKIGPATSQSSSEAVRDQWMESQKSCVYNRTRDTLLGLEVVQADTATDTLKRQVEYLAVRARTGLWLMPYQGIPVVPGVAPFDLVCLDSANRVIRLVESVVDAEMLPNSDEVYSALVLPSGTPTASSTEVGDLLDICTPDEMKQRFPHLSLQTRGSGGYRSIPAVREVNHMGTSVLSNGTSKSHRADVHPIRAPHSFDDDGEYDAPMRVTLKMRILRWLVSDRRGNKRNPKPRVIAYRWTGGNPYAHHVGDISDSGLYLVTEERWIPGTKILITLQRTDSEIEGEEESIAVEAKVVRWGPDGEGLAFVGAHPTEGIGEIWPDMAANRKELKNFLRRLLNDEDEAKVA